MASDSTQLCRRKGLINTLINSIRDTCIQIDELDLLALFTQFAPKSTRSIGSIQQPELVAALESLGVAVTQDQLDMLFGLFDAVDGGCDYAAFCTAIQDRSQEANDDHHEQLQETESKEACSEPKYEQREFSETAELMYKQKQQEIVEVCFCIWCIAVQEILAPVGAVPPMPSLDLVQQEARRPTIQQSPYQCTHKMRRKPRNVLEKLRLVAPSPIRQPMPVPPCSNPNEGNRHLSTVARHRQWNRIKLQEEASLVKEQALKRYAARISDAKVMVRDQALRIREGALATARRVARTEQQLELIGFQKQEENRRQTEASFNSERHRRNGIKRARREATQYRQRMRLQFQSMADQRPELAKPKKRLLAALPELPIVCFEPDAVFKRLLRYDKTKHFLAPMTWRT